MRYRCKKIITPALYPYYDITTESRGTFTRLINRGKLAKINNLLFVPIFEVRKLAEDLILIEVVHASGLSFLP